MELHIYLEPHAGKENELEALYRDAYVPGIKIQEGFQRTVLLKKSDALREYQIDIAFETETSRLKWVESDEHQAVWPKMAELCQQISWVKFDTITP
jgi:heme-degrading monooxygenase HmoA